jgi:NodT family efflux transporter outer membrane factor (OMF) lipoprotein
MRLCYRSLVLVSVTLALAACAAGPDFQAPEVPKVSSYGAASASVGRQDVTAVDEQYGQSSSPAQIAIQQWLPDEPVPVNWWQLFHAQELDSLMQRALSANRSLRAAQATLKQAMAIAEAQGGARYPQVDLVASSGRQQYGSEFLGSITPPPTFTYYALGPSVSYTLDFAGGVQRAIEQQQALAEFQRHQWEAAYLSLTGNVVSQALTAAACQTQIATIENLLVEDRRNLGLVQTAFAAGSVSRVDVLSAQSQVANDETLLPPLRQQRDVAVHALAMLVGELPADWSAPAFTLESFALPTSLPISFPSELAHQRPDILAAESQLHAATASYGVATANLYPHVTLNASFSQQSLTGAELFNASNRAWGVIAGLTSPLFDGGRLHAEQRAARARVESAAASYQQVVLQAFAQVADALDALNHDRDLQQAQEQAAAIAEQNLRLTQDSYAEGNVGVLQVLDSERAYQQAQLGRVRAQAQRLTDTARLFLSLGGSASQVPDGVMAWAEKR